MMRAVTGLLALGVACAGSAPARECLAPDSVAYQAASPEELYERGHLVEAAWRGWGAGGADGRLLAARSVLALAVIAPDLIDRDVAFDLAEEDLDAVLAQRPDDAFAQLQYVALLGLKGRTMSPVRAHLSGIGSRARKRLNALLEARPDDPYALYFSGLWHLELVARGGKRLAALFYDADAQAGLEQIEAALRLRPNDLAILFESGRALFAFQEEGEEFADLARRGRRRLERAAGLPPGDAVEEALAALANRELTGAPYDPRDHLCPPYWFNPNRLAER